MQSSRLTLLVGLQDLVRFWRPLLNRRVTSAQAVSAVDVRRRPQARGGKLVLRIWPLSVPTELPTELPESLVDESAPQQRMSYYRAREGFSIVRFTRAKGQGVAWKRLAHTNG